MLDTMFATETMAELSARQGRLADAMAIYRHLLAGAGGGVGDQAAGDTARIAKWKARLAELGSGPASSPDSPSPAREPEKAPPAPPEVTEPPAQRPSLVVRETVRSGQVIYADGRDLIVVASVNSGAQVLADGNIHVYGALKGRAVAGAHGQRDALVFCLALEAELVGVDTGYLLSDDLTPHWGAPARVELASDGRCAVTPLPLGKPGSRLTGPGRRT
jgi:septum site-determining protein MinC